MSDAPLRGAPDTAESGRARRRIPLLAILSGMVSGGLLVAIAEAVALPLSSASAPFIAVGGAFIDIIPPFVKDVAIALFGTNDKLVLFASMFAVYLVVCGVAGWIGSRRVALGGGILAGLGVFAAIIVLSRANTGPLDLIPTLAGTLLAVPLFVVMLRWIAASEGRAAGSSDPDSPQSRKEASAVGASRQGSAPAAGARRRPVLLVAAAGIGAVIIGAGARGVSAAREAARRATASFALPEPQQAADPIPEDAQSPVAGMPPYVTPNEDFYRIDTALAVPRVDVETWTLRIHGMVDREVTIDFAELLAEPMIEKHVTLTCVSNSVGGDLAGNATWLGVPVRTLLERAGVQDGADMVLSQSIDGFTASTPLEALTDDRDSLIAIGMNGEPLPEDHGYPARVVVPGLYGYVSATKWLTELKVTTFAEDTAYWTDRGWSAEGPIKLASRVDVPEAFGTLTPDAEGAVMLGGTAWAQQRGIAEVEVRIDDGDWMPAEIGTPANDDCWAQWSLRWEDATEGGHDVTVRAISKDGEVQTEERADPVPDGASGWQSIRFTVG